MKQCQMCSGSGYIWVMPYKVSPPSLNRPDACHEANSNIKLKVTDTCPQCKGKRN